MHISAACPINYCMKLLECLPVEIAEALRRIDDIRELRIRNGGAVKINVSGRWYYLGDGALCTSTRNAITLGKVCDDILNIACANSMYAHEKSLSNGYFTLEDGTRIGVCGQVAGSGENIFQSYTSLCFRIPHYVNCADGKLLNKCIDNNTVIIGKPGAGKTTLLRDIALKLGSFYNVLVVDERGELFYDECMLAASGCDILKRCSKSYAFDVGVRAMSPQYIVCDELSENDIVSVKNCLTSGVNLICSAHGTDEQDFENRFGLLNKFAVVVNLNLQKRN